MAASGSSSVTQSVQEDSRVAEFHQEVGTGNSRERKMKKQHTEQEISTTISTTALANLTDYQKTSKKVDIKNLLESVMLKKRGTKGGGPPDQPRQEGDQAAFRPVQRRGRGCAS